MFWKCWFSSQKQGKNIKRGTKLSSFGDAISKRSFVTLKNASCSIKTNYQLAVFFVNLEKRILEQNSFSLRLNILRLLLLEIE